MVGIVHGSRHQVGSQEEAEKAICSDRLIEILYLFWSLVTVNSWRWNAHDSPALYRIFGSAMFRWTNCKDGFSPQPVLPASVSRSLPLGWRCAVLIRH